MPELKFDQILQQIKSKDFKPIYFLHGEESYFIDELTQAFEQHALPEEHRAFNQTILYGKDIGSEIGKVIDLAMRLPMMAERQLVIIKEAQHIRGWENLMPYLNHPTNSTVLVLAHKNKKLDGRSAFAKTLKKNAILFHSSPLRDYEMSSIIPKMVKETGMSITPKASELLIEFLGTDLGKIAKEIDKLKLVVSSQQIDAEEIEENIGISKDYNVFELQNALLQKDEVKVFRILSYFRQNPKAGNIVFVISVLYSVFSKLYTLLYSQSLSDADIARKVGVSPYFLKQYKQALRIYSPLEINNALKLLATYDLKSKGVDNVSTNGDELLKELCYHLMNDGFILN